VAGIAISNIVRAFGGEMRKFGIQAPEPRQTFSHARTKPLVVEKRRRRMTLRCPSWAPKWDLCASRTSLRQPARSVNVS